MIHLFDEKMRFFGPKLGVFSDFGVESPDLLLELGVLKLASVAGCVSYLFMGKLGEFVCKTGGMTRLFSSGLVLMPVFQLTGV